MSCLTSNEPAKVVYSECKYSHRNEDVLLPPDIFRESSEEVKRQRKGKKYRSYQEKKWHKRFEELIAFKKLHNHCLVSEAHPTKSELARWVKRQRYQYNLFKQGKPSYMTIERAICLDGFGFIWDAHEALWRERLKDLAAFKNEHGHCNVPSRYQKNMRLATWVKCQRRQYKLYRENQPSNMTRERIVELEKYDFQWECRKGKTYKEMETRIKENSTVNDSLSLDSGIFSLLDNFSNSEISKYLPEAELCATRRNTLQISTKNQIDSFKNGILLDYMSDLSDEE